MTADPATQTTLAAVLAKLVAAPALEGGNLATIVTSLASILAKQPVAPAVDGGSQVSSDMLLALRVIINYLARPIWMHPATGHVRVGIETAAGLTDTLSTVTTVGNVSNIAAGTITNLTQLGSYAPKQTLLDTMEGVNWNGAVRSRIV